MCKPSFRRVSNIAAYADVQTTTTMLLLVVPRSGYGHILIGITEFGTDLMVYSGRNTLRPSRSSNSSSTCSWSTLPVSLSDLVARVRCSTGCHSVLVLRGQLLPGPPHLGFVRRNGERSGLWLPAAHELPGSLHPVLHSDVQEAGRQEGSRKRQGERCCKWVRRVMRDAQGAFLSDTAACAATKPSNCVLALVVAKAQHSPVALYDVDTLKMQRHSRSCCERFGCVTCRLSGVR